MLILTRYPKQEVIINGEIIVQIMGVQPDGAVVLGFKAPENIVIDRLEVWNRKLEFEGLPPIPSEYKYKTKEELERGRLLRELKQNELLGLNNESF